MTDDPDARRARRAGERYPEERRPERQVERRPDEPRTGPRRPADPRRTVLAVVAAVVVIGFLVFWIQNHYRISISYLTVRLTAPLWLIVTFYFLAGAVVGVLLTVYYQRRRP